MTAALHWLTTPVMVPAWYIILWSLIPCAIYAINARQHRVDRQAIVDASALLARGTVLMAESGEIMARQQQTIDALQRQIDPDRRRAPTSPPGVTS